jgi:hypothetical protein
MPRIWNSGFKSSSSSAHSHGQREGGGGQQSQSSSSQQQQHPNKHRSNFKSALEHISVPESLFRGISVFKVNAKGKLEPATLAISNDKFVISVLPRAAAAAAQSSSRPTPAERNGSIGGAGSSISSGSSIVGGSLKRPGILSRGRSGNTSQGSVGGGSIGTMGSMDGETNFSFNPDTSLDIGSIDRIQSGQNTLLFEKAR